MNNTRKALIAIFLASTFLTNQIALADDYGYGYYDEAESSKTLLYTGLAVGIAGAATAAVLAFLQNDEESVIASKIEVNNIHFTTPGENNRQTLTIKNTSTETTTINNIIFTGGAKEYVTTYQNDCPKNLAPNESCTIILEASIEAYDGAAIIDHGYNNINTTSSITTAKVPLELYETTSGEPVLIPASKNINLEKELDDEKSKKQTFKWVNNGKFYWQKPYLEKKSWFSNNDVTLDEETCGTESNPGDPVAPGGECTFSTTVKTVELDATATLSTKSALNTLDLPAYNKTVITGNGLEITNNQNAADYHLGYRSLNLTSTASQKTITLEDIGTKISTDKIEYCSASSSCSDQFKPDSNIYNNCKIGETLAPGDSCKLWMHANRGSATYPYTENNQTVAVTAEWSWPGSSNVNESETFAAKSDLALYAGGEFTSPSKYIAKWDGTNWHTLTSDVTGVVRTLFVHTNTGDLYVGGEFEGPYAYLMRWNGYNWNKMNNGPDDRVMTIDHHSKSDKLYIGGIFKNPGSRVARCDENDNCEQAIPKSGRINSGTVYSLTGDDNFIYIAGNFIVADSSIDHRYTAAWNVNSEDWDPMRTGEDPDSTMYKLGGAGSFGIITGVGEKFAAKWDTGSGWDFFWNYDDTIWHTRYNPFSDGVVRAMTNLTKDGNTYLYVGGDFTSNYKHIAKRQYGSSANWVSLGDGVNGGTVTIW